MHAAGNSKKTQKKHERFLASSVCDQFETRPAAAVHLVSRACEKLVWACPVQAGRRQVQADRPPAGADCARLIGVHFRSAVDSPGPTTSRRNRNAPSPGRSASRSMRLRPVQFRPNGVQFRPIASSSDLLAASRGRKASISSQMVSVSSQIASVLVRSSIPFWCVACVRIHHVEPNVACLTNVAVSPDRPFSLTSVASLCCLPRW